MDHRMRATISAGAYLGSRRDFRWFFRRDLDGSHSTNLQHARIHHKALD